MKTMFDDAMREATLLTRRGNLADATQLIQRALAGHHPVARHATSPPPPARVRLDAHVVAVAADARADAFLDGHFSDGSLDRSYKLFVPAKATVSPGLVVMLHGCTQDPNDFARGTRANDAAADAGCLVLYPAQSKRANANGCWNWFERAHQTRDHGEAAFLAALTREIVREHGIDPTRVFVAGLSAGGAMADVLATEYPDVYAAACIHSGLPAGVVSGMPQAFEAMRSGATASKRRTSVPTIVFHGEQDHTVHASNADAIASAAVAGIAGSAGTTTRSDELRDAKGRRVTRTCYRVADRTVVEKWTVRSAGHAWFGGSSSGSFTDEHGIDATREMFRFFADHSRVGKA